MGTLEFILILVCLLIAIVVCGQIFYALYSTQRRLKAQVQELNQALIASEKKCSQLASSLDTKEDHLCVVNDLFHNIGNVFNSLSISSSQLEDKVHQLKLQDIVKAAKIFFEHKDDLVEFLTEDENGKHFSDFLIHYGQYIQEEERTLLRSIEHFKSNVAHIQNIIIFQQGLSAGPTLDTVSLQAMVQGLITIYKAQLDHNQIEVYQEHALIPDMELSKTKILQVLGNLLVNSKQALLKNDPLNREITIKTLLGPKQNAIIEFSDNGPGISVEEREKVFSRGFTTKSNGRGLGLSYCQSEIHGLGGEIELLPDHYQRGTTFRISIPLKKI